MTLLSDSEQQEVAAAIRSAEAHTQAEVVTVLARKADDYHYIPLLWAGLAALTLPGLVKYYAQWLSASQLVLCQWVLFCVLALLLRLPALGTRLIPRAVRHWRAGNLARRQFLEQNLHHTRGEVGVLIFVSEAERYVEILVDRGVASVIPDRVWEESVARFTQRVRQGQVREGFIECIEACGEELHRALPATEEKNELPNHLVVLD